VLDLIQTKVNYVIQESVVIIKDIFRKYPNKANMIWIMGGYVERIDNTDKLLESFLDNFHDENSQVQRPTGTQELVQQVLPGHPEQQEH